MLVFLHLMPVKLLVLAVFLARGKAPLPCIKTEIQAKALLVTVSAELPFFLHSQYLLVCLKSSELV